MYGGAWLEAQKRKRCASIDCEALCVVFSHIMETKNLFKKKFASSLPAWSQASLYFAKEEFSIPMIPHPLQKCTDRTCCMNVMLQMYKKGVRFFFLFFVFALLIDIILSWLTCSWGGKEKKKPLKQYKSVTSTLPGSCSWCLWNCSQQFSIFQDWPGFDQLTSN